MKNIILTTINAKWIHPSLALRLLKANLRGLEESCLIMEFALRQKLSEKVEPLLAALAPAKRSPQDGALSRRTKILGVSVSIWNHLATIELLRELEKASLEIKPVIVMGGPEVSRLPPDAGIFQFADFVIRGEGETAFRTLCEEIFDKQQEQPAWDRQRKPRFIDAGYADVREIKSAYHLYEEEDTLKKLTYVEASRGCPFNCEFCQSAGDNAVREFPIETFLAGMDALIQRGARKFKFLDRSFNVNIERSLKIMEFFLDKITRSGAPLVVHFEMVPSIFPPELLRTLSRFPPGTLRLEIGIQSLNPRITALIKRPSNPEKELETIRSLREKTNAVIHADLIAGLPGEDLVSFAKSFDSLWLALRKTNKTSSETFTDARVEIQPGILKLLPGTPISRHSEAFGMRYNSLPPYEVEETSAMSASDIKRVKNFARFWEVIVNRRLARADDFAGENAVFENFMELSDSLFAHFGRNWGIDKSELTEAVKSFSKTASLRFALF